MDSKIIPDIVIGRLPIYLRALQRMLEEGRRVTSSQELGEKLGISAAQIRKDLSQFGEFGKQGTGYHIKYLIDKFLQVIFINSFVLGLSNYVAYQRPGAAHFIHRQT